MSNEDEWGVVPILWSFLIAVASISTTLIAYHGISIVFHYIRLHLNITFPAAELKMLVNSTCLIFTVIASTLHTSDCKNVVRCDLSLIGPWWCLKRLKLCWCKQLTGDASWAPWDESSVKASCVFFDHFIASHTNTLILGAAPALTWHPLCCKETGLFYNW